jgi:Ca2+-binding EF-hand superfamily protein
MNKLIKVALIGKRGRGAQIMDAGAVFDSLDLDGNGSLSLEELAKVLGTDAKDFLDCLDTVHKDGSVDREEFLRWSETGGDEFANLDAQLAKIYQEVAAGTLHLFSKYADKVAQSRKSNVPVVDLKSN